MDTCLAPALASYGGAAGRANASRFFDVLKCASLLVARSDWTAARVLLFKMDNEECRLLINLYKDRRSLWDPEHNNYHNSTRREDSLFLLIHQNSMYHNKRHCSKSTRWRHGCLAWTAVRAASHACLVVLKKDIRGNWRLRHPREASSQCAYTA
jgi:isocitrate lyase